MSITREQVADLQPGDVVEYRHDAFPDVTLRGPLHVDSDGDLMLGKQVIRFGDGDPTASAGRVSLTVISRAPRPLYVNHDRTEVVAGDVAKDEDGKVWHAIGNSAYFELRWWGWNTSSGKWMHVGLKWHKGPLRLLVDGETGQVVP